MEVPLLPFLQREINIWVTTEMFIDFKMPQ